MSKPSRITLPDFLTLLELRSRETLILDTALSQRKRRSQSKQPSLAHTLGRSYARRPLRTVLLAILIALPVVALIASFANFKFDGDAPSVASDLLLAALVIALYSHVVAHLLQWVLGRSESRDTRLISLAAKTRAKRTNPAAYQRRLDALPDPMDPSRGIMSRAIVATPFPAMGILGSWPVVRGLVAFTLNAPFVMLLVLHTTQKPGWWVQLCLGALFTSMGAILIIFVFGCPILRWHLESRVRRRRCTNCNYDLAGLNLPTPDADRIKDRCPECGCRCPLTLVKPN